jgi:transcriptional regulator with XRE-family HTH domain
MLGEALRLIRIYHDCKSQDLAKALDLSPSYISELERNKKTPSLDVIKKYADYFGTTASAIMFFSEDIDKDKKRPGRAFARKRLVRFLKMFANEDS